MAKVIYFVGGQSAGAELDAQKLIKIGDKVLFGRGVSDPQTINVSSVKLEELHKSLEVLAEQYTCAKVAEQ